MRCPSAIKTIQMNQIKVMPSHASVAYNSPFDFICGPLASRRCRRVSVTEPSIRESSLNFITYVNSRSQAKWLLFFFFVDWTFFRALFDVREKWWFACVATSFGTEAITSFYHCILYPWSWNCHQIYGLILRLTDEDFNSANQTRAQQTTKP